MLQSDYNQERSTASQATELLEQETSRRLLLESELYDVQSHLQQSTDKMSAMSEELRQLQEIHQRSYVAASESEYDMADGKLSEALVHVFV